MKGFFEIFLQNKVLRINNHQFGKPAKQAYLIAIHAFTHLLLNLHCCRLHKFQYVNSIQTLPN